MLPTEELPENFLIFKKMIQAKITLKKFKNIVSPSRF